MNEELTIQRVGFRKWYERELLQSHGYLVLLILCLVAFLGGIELFGGQGSAERQWEALACAGASGVIGAWAVRRYLYLLAHAQYVAEQAVCRVCQAYAKWDVVDSPHEPPQQQRMCVKCRRCGNSWHIALG